MAGTVQAAYDPRIAWISRVFGIVQLDFSTVGGADVLAASSWSQDFDSSEYDRLNDPATGLLLDSATIVRGRSDDLSLVESGTCEMIVIDHNGTLNPKSTSSPLYGIDWANVNSVRPNRPGRFTMNYGGTTYPLYYGFVRSVDYDPGIRIGSARIELDDLFGWLSTPRADGTGASPKPVITRVNNTTTGAAIGLILDAIGWTDTSMRLLDAGDDLPWFEAIGEQTPLELIRDLVQANGGLFYIDAAGRAVFEDRNTRWLRTAYASIVNTMTRITPGTARDGIVNVWNGDRQYETTPGNQTTLTDGPTQTASNTASMDEFGYRDNSLASKYWPSNSFALNAMQWRLQQTKDPAVPVWTLSLDNREADMMLAMAGAELNRRISVAEARDGTSGDYFIEQIRHTISRADRSHKCDLILTERIAAQAPFIVGVDTVGDLSRVGF